MENPWMSLKQSENEKQRYVCGIESFGLVLRRVQVGHMEILTLSFRKTLYQFP